MRYAAEFNAPFGAVESTGKLVATVQRVAAEAGRTDLVCSAAQEICAGADDAAVARRAGVLGREVEDLRANALAGSPAQVVDTLGRFAEVGVSRVYLQLMDLTDLDQLELVASTVLPQV